MTSNQEKTHPLENISKRIIYFLIFIVAIAPITQPIGLPVPVGQRVIDSYNAINDLPPDSVVIVTWEGLVGHWINIGAGAVAIADHLFSLPIKVIFVGFSIDSPMLIYRIIDAVDVSHKEYGVDWVFLGYAAGDESAIASLAKDFSSVYKTDVYGTPIEEIPIMNEVQSAEDVDIIVGMEMNFQYWLRQWVMPYGVPVIACTIPMSLPGYLPYYFSGEIKGIISGMRGAAEYEQLIKKPGYAMASQDAVSLEFLLMAILMIIGTIGFQLRRSGG
jgi:hypothetical protein